MSSLRTGTTTTTKKTESSSTTWRHGGGLTTSIRSDWSTPRALFAKLDEEFHFTLDVCATDKTALCKEFFTNGGLERRWVPVRDGAVWCNPPYGREIGKWVEAGYRESRTYGTVVMLVPARTDTSWFHSWILNKAEIRFIQGRLCFDDNPRKRAPFPSMLVIYRAR